MSLHSNVFLVELRLNNGGTRAVEIAPPVPPNIFSRSKLHRVKYFFPPAEIAPSIITNGRTSAKNLEKEYSYWKTGIGV
jgi:hypothetical protein